MLEFSNYYIKNVENLIDLFTIIFTIIDDIYNEIIADGIKNRHNVGDNKLSDSEIIDISIVGEILTIDSEKAFYSLLKREYKSLFLRLGDRIRFNRTKRNLHAVISKIREHISLFMQSYTNNIRIVDSMPIPVCEFGRAFLVRWTERHKIYMMTWDYVFKSFDIRHRYLLDKLNIHKSIIQDELLSKGIDL